MKRKVWCGRGIQKGCAVHKLDKMFVIFAGAVQLTISKKHIFRRMKCRIE